MRVDEIQEGGCYVSDEDDRYFRRVDLIVAAPNRPGGQTVAWSTEGFQVKRRNGDNKGPTRGKCGIATFATWATRRID